MTNLRRKVVVITGASSGIGRAAARLFAERGARVVLAARQADELQAAAAECAALGTSALAVPTDVGDPTSVDALAAVALSEFSAIDVWVNDAAVYATGELADIPVEVHRRLVEVNVLGVIHGMRAALQYFGTRGQGTIINVASVAGRAADALAATYSGTKAAVRAMSEAVRQEVRGRGNIHVCIVSPASVDTPLFAHAANYSGRELRPIPPIYDVERVARAIVRCAERPRRELSVGAAPALLAFLRTVLAPRHLDETPAADGTGNLFAPRGPWRESGGHA